MAHGPMGLAEEGLEEARSDSECQQLTRFSEGPGGSNRLP